MPSTYTSNNGIELIGTGEQSGTWGETTNTNFGLIDTALDGQLTKTLASAGTSGSPNTLIIEDGTTSDGRNRLVIFNDGSDLGGTAYVQLTPDNAEKIMFVRNSLSGERSIIFFQGTYNASNDFELPNGTDAVIKFNGAGTGAVVEAVFKKLYLQDLLLDTSSAQTMYIESTIPTFNMKETDADLNEKFWRLQTSAGVFKVDAVNDAYDTAATAYSVNRSGVTPNLHIWYSNASEAMRVTSAGNVGIGASNPTAKLTVIGDAGVKPAQFIQGADTVNDRIILAQNAGGQNFGAYVDASTVRHLVSGQDDVFTTNGTYLTLNTNGGVERMRITSTGNVGIGTSSPTEKLHLSQDSAFAIQMERTGGSPSVCEIANGGNLLSISNNVTGIVFLTGATPEEAVRIEASGNVGIGTDDPTTTLDVNGTITGTGLDMNGAADFGGNIALSRAASTILYRTDDTGIVDIRSATASLSGSSIALYAGSNASLPNYSIFGGDTMFFRPVDGSPEFMRFVDGTGAVFNETGADVDFRIESDTNTHAFFLQGSDGYVGIGTSSPEAPLTVAPGGTSTTSIGGRNISYGVNTIVTSGRTGYLCRVGNNFTGDGDNAGFQWIYPFDSGGNVNNKVFRSATGATLVDKFWVNQVGGGYFAGNVGIGTSSPSAKLDVNGAAEINDTLLISRAAVAPKINFENSSYAGGDGGIGYFNSGALTFDTNAAERMRIDASGNLSVGTSTALGRFVSERPAGAGWALAGKTAGIANEGGLYFDATNNGELVARNASGTVNVSLKSNGDSYLNGGNVGIGTSSPSQALDVVGSIEVSGGIYLGGTAAANLLDDYEEGTWTPEFVPAIGSLGSITYGIQAATYTKVGRQVTVTGRFQTTGSVTIGTASTAMRISGLPFAAGSGEAFYAAAGLSYVESWTAGNAPSSAYVANNSTVIQLRIRNSGADGPETNMTPSEFVSGADGGCSLMFSATYFTA